MLNERFIRAITALIYTALKAEVVEICLLPPLDSNCPAPSTSAFKAYTPQNAPLYCTAFNPQPDNLRFEHLPWPFFASVPIYFEDAVAGNLWIASDTEAPSQSSAIPYLQQMAELISERLEAEEKYELDRQRSQLLNQYIEMSVDSSGFLDRDLRFLSCNDAYQKLSVFSKDWIIGKTMAEMGFPDAALEQLEPWKHMILSVFESGKPDQQSFTFPEETEEQLTQYTSLAIPQVDRCGKTVAVFNVSTVRNLYAFDKKKTWKRAAEKLFHEIAAHRETQQRLTALNAELEDRVAQRTEQLIKADKAKSIFLANASHELRTPMNGVIGMADLLCNTELSTEQRELTETLMLCAHQMLALINNILDFSKVEAGRMERDPEPFGVRSLVTSVEAMLKESARIKGLHFAVEIDSAVPQILIGDSVKIVQILSNLASNAIKFTATGHVRIRVQLTDSPNHVHFAVEDTGIGINPGDLGRLFTAFTQADASTTRRFGGTGLGLAISKQLVELMGGRISVESLPGEGSTFCFALPLDTFEVSSAPPTSPAQERSALQRFDAKILIVEDNPVNQIVLLRHLQQLRYTCVDVANNGLQAVAAADGTNYDLILMDCQMPEMDGFEATRIIRSRNIDKSIPIVAITALSNLGERERCQSVGMNGFLHKPYTREQLETTLQNFLGLL
jgi:signal transduction histidine kinase/ActR/RegA family two-component response regulator